MSAKESILNPSGLKLEGNFKDQVTSLMRTIRLTKEEVESLKNLYYDIEYAFKFIWPGCMVIPFGSIVTGLGLKTSDADCYVQLPNGCQDQQDVNVMQARGILRRHPKLFTKIFAIPQAKVPIIKCLHIPTNTDCDISFKNPSGTRNSMLICTLLKFDKRYLNLAIIVKYWSKVHLLTGVNLLSNYALVLMVLQYLQHKSLLPSVMWMQSQVDPYFVGNWNHAFLEDLSNCAFTITVPLIELIGGFFQYYSNFDFNEEIVSPYYGSSMHKSVIKDWQNLPDEFSCYKNNLQSGMPPLKFGPIYCVQDPFEHNRNCAVPVSVKLARILKCYFKLGYRLYTETAEQNHEEFLYKLFNTKVSYQLPTHNVQPFNQNNKNMSKIAAKLESGKVNAQGPKKKIGQKH